MNPPTTPPANSEAAQAALNWPEDATHENGNYQNKCIHCGSIFIGHKRRATCRVCSTPESVKEEIQLLQAALAEKEAVSVARAEQDIRSYWQAVSDGADWQMRAEKAEAALAAANKRISDLEAITPDEALKVFLESSEQLRREAEQERGRYRTALEQIADPDCTDYDCPQCGRIVSKHPTGECPSCGFLSQGQIKAALATPGDAGEEEKA